MNALPPITHAERIALERVHSEDFCEFLKLAWPQVDPQPYVHNWHMEVLGEHLTALAYGEMKRLLVNVPPGTSKSMACSVIFPAWLWGPFGWPEFKFLGGSYDEDLAIRDNRTTRRLVESDWFQDRWPLGIASDQNEKRYFENTSRGFRQARAIRSFTGRRGDGVVWDDPLNAEQANSDDHRNTANRVLDETLPSRLIDPVESFIMVIMQRLHEDDVSGHILTRELGYDHLILPMEFEPARRCYTSVAIPGVEPTRVRFDRKAHAWRPEPEDQAPQDEPPDAAPVAMLWSHDRREEDGDLLFPDRFPRHVVDRDKKAMGSYATAGQFQQSPHPRGGTRLTKELFEIVPALPAEGRRRSCRGWDLAATDRKKNPDAARTSSTLIWEVAGVYYIADNMAEQLGPLAVEMAVKNTATRDGAGILISLPQDPGQAGVAQKMSFAKLLAGFQFKCTPESGDKETRADPFVAQCEAGNVKLVKGAWNDPYLDEICTFPRGKWKDRMDATSRAFAELVIPAQMPLSGKQG